QPACAAPRSRASQTRDGRATCGDPTASDFKAFDVAPRTGSEAAATATEMSAPEQHEGVGSPASWLCQVRAPRDRGSALPPRWPVPARCARYAGYLERCVAAPLMLKVMTV